MTRERMARTQGRRRLGTWPIFAAVVATLISLAVLAGLLWMGLSWLLLRNWPWEREGTLPSQADLLKLALAIAAGAGGAVALVVAYRRQRHLETDSAGARDQVRLMTERFGAAAAQLGSDRPAIRLAGVYAMARLADEWEDQQQQCIDVLCAYVRLPYLPEHADSSESEGATGEGGPVASGQQAGDREVRQTVIRVIADHLQDDDGSPAASSWRGRSFDLTGARLEGASFKGAKFTNGSVSFKDSKFVSGTVSFEDAEFSGADVSFAGAVFSGGNILLTGARLTGGVIDFTGAQFHAPAIRFEEATLDGSTIRFRGVKSCEDGYTFSKSERLTDQDHGMRIASGAIEISDCINDGALSFYRMTMEGGSIRLGRANARNGIHLDRCTLSGGLVVIDIEDGQAVTICDSIVLGARIEFGRRWTGARLDMTRTQLRSGSVIFGQPNLAVESSNFLLEDMDLSGGTIDIHRPIFRGGGFTFRGTNIRDGVIIRVTGGAYDGREEPLIEGEEYARMALRGGGFSLHGVSQIAPRVFTINGWDVLDLPGPSESSSEPGD